LPAVTATATAGALNATDPHRAETCGSIMPVRVAAARGALTRPMAFDLLTIG
jgi:hypothetical protein